MLGVLHQTQCKIELPQNHTGARSRKQAFQRGPRWIALAATPARGAIRPLQNTITNHPTLGLMLGIPLLGIV